MQLLKHEQKRDGHFPRLPKLAVAQNDKARCSRLGLATGAVAFKLIQCPSELQRLFLLCLLHDFYQELHDWKVSSGNLLRHTWKNP